LVEFKPVFEFICLNSFKNLQNVSFSSPFSFLLRPNPAFAAQLLAQPNQITSRGPARLFQLRSPACLASRAAHLWLKSGPRRLLSLCLADGWGPVVIPDLRPDPEPNPTERVAPWLRVASLAPMHGPKTWACASGPASPFKARRRTEAPEP
jgi:hypothetical protein